MDDKDLLILFAGIALGGLIVYFVTKQAVGSGGRAMTPIASNKEVWQWTDYHGKNREITVHREVKG